MTGAASRSDRCSIGVQAPPVTSVEGARNTFMSAMSDCGLKPTVVYHNLTPAELYEKVRAADRHMRGLAIPAVPLCCILHEMQERAGS